MERMRVLIADDDKAHLEKVFKIVNAQDPLTPEEKVWTGEGRLVGEALSNRSAKEFPHRLEGNIEILCAQSYEGALSLIEEHGDVDICLSDIQFSGEKVDGPSVLNECGVSSKNGILYTGQSEKQQIYEGSDTYIENRKDYPGAGSRRFRVVRFARTKDFEDIICRFLMESEYLLAKDRIEDRTPDTGLSSEAKASWRNFENQLNSLLSGDRPDRGDLQNCDAALTLEGGLEETRFGGIQFKHLFPFRDAFLNRRLSEVDAILNGEAYPSWSRVKNKTKVLAEEIHRLILDKEDPAQEEKVRMKKEDSAQDEKVRVKAVHLNLKAPTNEALKVVTNVGKKTLSDIGDRGIFLLLAIKIRDSENIPVNGPVTTTYKRWSPPLVVSSLLINHFRGGSGHFTTLERSHSRNAAGEEVDKIESGNNMFIEYITENHEENSKSEVWKKVEEV